MVVLLYQNDYVSALIDAIGVEIGNHCQGNIRRVATCALGDIDWTQQVDRQLLSITMEKLNWTLQHPDDWGLRYSACIALEGIGTSSAKALLLDSRVKEGDPLISKRIDIALSAMSKINASQ